jgi:hypothetical protein
MAVPRQGLAVAVLAAALLVGCVPPASQRVTQAPPEPAVAPPAAPPAPEPAAPAPPQRVSDPERLLYYYEYLVALPADQVARETERTQRFFGQHRSEFALLQLALLRSLPGASARERTQATEALAQFLKETRDRGSDLRPFALLVNNLLIEQQRMEADLQAQGQKLKDEAKRYDELKQKLDALIETERKMLERNKPTRTQ